MLVALLPLLSGMGKFPSNKNPKVDRYFSATYVDQSGVQTECTEVNIEGQTFIEGNRGDGTLTIGFEKIKSILFQMKNDQLFGYVTLYDGSETILTLDKKKKAIGRAKSGVFRIALSDLKKMIISSMQISGPRE